MGKEKNLAASNILQPTPANTATFVVSNEWNEDRVGVRLFVNGTLPVNLHSYTPTNMAHVDTWV